MPGTSLLSSNPKYNPLGTFGTLLPDIGAAAGEVVAPGNPFSTAAFLTKGGFDLSQGNILGGLGQFAGAGLPFVLPSGLPGSVEGAGTGAAATGASTGAASSLLPSWLTNLPGNIESYFSGGGGGAAGDAATAAPSAAGGFGGAAPGSGAPFNLAPTAGASPEANAVALGLNPVSTGATTSGALSAATGGGAGGGAGNIFSTISNLPSWAKVGGGLLLSQLLSPLLSKITGGGLTSQEQNLLKSAQGQLSGSSALINSLQSGVLPPGAQAAVNQATNADIENIASRYAGTGQAGSMGEQQDIANARQQAAANQFTEAQSAAQTGLSELGLEQGVYGTLLNDQLSRQSQLGNSFSQLFSALALGSALKGAA